MNIHKMPKAPALEGVVVVRRIKRSPAETRPDPVSILANIFKVYQSMEVRVTNHCDLVATTAAKKNKGRVLQ